MQKGVWAWVVAVILGVATRGSLASLGPDMYEDMLLNDLYKRMRLEDEYYNLAGNDAGQPMRWLDEPSNEEIALDSRDMSSTEIRDPEHLDPSTSLLDKFQYISGGNSEQHASNMGESPAASDVKSDENLPYYCHPPNPCPKGFSAKDGCQEDIQDTAKEQREWIDGLMTRGLCSCDEEHMFHCPRSGNGAPARGNSPLDSLLDSLLDKAKEVDPYVVKGNKRASLVAKKSPIVKRSVKYTAEDMRQAYQYHAKKNSNPYLFGKHLQSVEKKAGPQF